MHDLEKMLNDYRLTTAKILYHRPDHPWLLQTFVWQELDLLPRYPELKKFLKFWEDNLYGKLHSVIVTSSGLIKPQEFSFAKGEFHVQ